MSEAPRYQMQLRLAALKTERASFWTHWAEISKYILPRSGRYFVEDRNKGGKRHNAIFDSTGTRALRVLGAGLMSGATSPARPWFRLVTPDPEMMKFAPVKVWCNDVTRMMLDTFQRTNTYRSLHVMYEELGAFGTAACFVEDDFDNVIHHTPLATGEYYISTDGKGAVCTLVREFQMTVGAVVKTFGYKNCQPRTQNLYNRGSLDQWITVVHFVEPRADRDASKADALNMPWRSCYYEQGFNDEKYLRDGGYKRFRGLCPRWSVAGGDIYATNSPGMEALGDIKQLQHEQLRKGEAIDFQTKPPLQVPTALKNRDVDRLPGGITYYDSSSPTGGIKSMFDVPLRLDYLLADIQDVRQRIRECFYTDLFLMLAQQTPSTMTATEVAERQEEKLLMLGPVLERLHNELLQPLVEMTFDRLIEAGMVPPPPEELQGQDINIEFVSVLAQAQRAVSTAGVDRFVGNLGAVAQFKPDVLDKFDADKWADIYSDQLGVDPQLIVADDKVALVRKLRAQQQAAAQQSALMEQQANAAQKLGNAPTDGKNALTDVMGMFTGYSGNGGITQ